MAESVIQIKNLQKVFGEREVLKSINFNVDKGEVVTLIGSSGSGKSTLLRCINLLETPTSGAVLYHGKDIQAPGYNQQSYCAKVGMVFQQFNLFNNMTVLENCVYPQVKVLGRSEKEAQENAKNYLRKVGMIALSMLCHVNFQGDKSNVLRLLEPYLWIRKSCFLMSQPLLLIRKW